MIISNHIPEGFFSTQDINEWRALYVSKAELEILRNALSKNLEEQQEGTSSYDITRCMLLLLKHYLEEHKAENHQ